MTWWLLLFALSMLARYHPLVWIRALDVDTSAVAVTLERAMRKAVDALPQLVSEAIYGISMPVPELTESPFD
jgi:YaaC-like protein